MKPGWSNSNNSTHAKNGNSVDSILELYCVFGCFVHAGNSNQFFAICIQKLAVQLLPLQFYAKIMVVGDGQFYRGFGGYWVFWFLGCHICMSMSIWNGFGIS